MARAGCTRVRSRGTQRGVPGALDAALAGHRCGVAAPAALLILLGGVQRVAEDLMAEADPKHASGYLTPSVGILGLVHNGWAPSTCRPQTLRDVQTLREVCFSAIRLALAQRHSRGLPRRPFIAAVIAFVIAQTLKAFTFWYSERRWDWTRLIGSGGMPSSHTGCVRATICPLPTRCRCCLGRCTPVQHDAVCCSEHLLIFVPLRGATFSLAMTVPTHAQLAS